MNRVDDSVGDRRAIEALRNGVPNADAVRVLGSGQQLVEETFLQRLSEVDGAARAGRQVPGLLVKGGFGTGKSHLLKYLQVKAVSENFVCSHVVVSKETPLFNPAKVYRAAIESAVGLRLNGQAIKAMALGLRQETPSYAELYIWANRPDAGVHQVFPATLLLHERLKNDPEFVERITSFWSGDPLKIADVKRELRQVKAAATFDLKGKLPPSLPLERFRFAARLIRGAGYKGWVLLLDEIELVGRFNVAQRAKSYAELARWMGANEGAQFPGLMAVGAITDDFDLAVLQQKGDRDVIGPRLRSKGTLDSDLVAAQAEAGMRIIEQAAMRLTPPNETVLRQTYGTLKDIHARAYGWEPPDVDVGHRSTTRAMRSYVRRFINEWDLKRLYPDAVLNTQDDPLSPTYVNDPALQQPSHDDGDDDTDQLQEQDDDSLSGPI